MWITIDFQLSIMNKSQIIFTPFSLEYLQEAVTMVADAFEANNVFSQKGLQTREELEFRTSVSIQLFHNAMVKYNQENKSSLAFLHAFMYRGKLVAMVMACELHIFIDDMLSLIDPEDPYVEGFKVFTKERFPRNTTLLFSLLAVHKDHMKENLANLLIKQVAQQWTKTSFKKVVGGSTNPISLKMAKKLGIQLQKEICLNRNGNTSSLYLLVGDREIINKVMAKL